ncbi:putative ribosome-binding factor A, mitochondrial [Lutzomyia longipalpis]|uniref:Putative ribosome-binding factor a n=1 Tax=Lutzomyia longipalpis TaxID=7200 RepID=A0A1B0CXC2_LUTLO|nr:putative ribosome-binding factor A, mitochondrial [Lutzomyia longipalpis]
MNFLAVFRQFSAIVRSLPARGLHTTPCSAKQKLPTFSASRQSKIMDKLMHGRDKGKRHWYAAKVPGGAHVGSASAKAISSTEGQPRHVLKRVTVLNKLFMRNIAEIMATGELSQEILGRGLEICRVKVSPDFHVANVYWMAKGTDEDDVMEELLGRISGRLRHELSQLRLMGEVPRISFIKDLNYAKFQDVDRLLAKADFGEDYVPFYMRQKEDIAVDRMQNEFVAPDALPEMRQDVFGLNHEEIMRKITQTLGKTKSAWEKYEFGAKHEESPQIQRPGRDPEALAAANLHLEERFTQFLKNQHRSEVPERKKHRPEIHEIPQEELSEEFVDNSLFEEENFDDYPVEKK